MASKVEAKPAVSWEVVFVKCELDKETKEQAKKWDLKYEATFNGLERLINDGYKLSISRDTYHDATGVFLTMPTREHAHHGYCLTARGPDILSALKMLVYKHYNVLGEHWDTEVAERPRHDVWG